MDPTPIRRCSMWREWQRFSVRLTVATVTLGVGFLVAPQEAFGQG